MPTKFMTFTGVASWADEDAHPEHPIVIPPPDYHPEHPIVIPDPPPVDSSGGVPTHPIYLPPVPTHPIVLPPGGEKPPVDTGAHPEHPIYYPPGIWGGANEPFPTPPIYFPDPAPPSGSGLSGWTWVWLPVYGRWALLPPDDAAQPKGRKK